MLRDSMSLFWVMWMLAIDAMLHLFNKAIFMPYSPVINSPYCLVYTEHGSYLALRQEISDRIASSFWQQIRHDVAALLALPLTVYSYFSANT